MVGTVVGWGSEESSWLVVYQGGSEETRGKESPLSGASSAASLAH